MSDFEGFKQHYLKVSGRSNLSATEDFYVRQLFDFLKDKDVKTKVGEVGQLGKVCCPVCDTEFAVPMS